ncbi:probable mediator of RNA polymerase II transcription subunit 26b [Dioscorea cayenensis subsp. rotundata]|uniref:Probable mediator of RNA polymerase II transcription subunit 26b n=1 Tax=Dioscorea cayennensis subsp. rotundata TaxID=55577 RepID=A0AB40AK40_DIOCR|nr:probable mediator of RNA polymerase II transcription subunit 26b [Dioscorea cayenensis subsp. rotundata]
MAGSSSSMDYWRRFFRSANSDIFDVIEKAIMVAASDHSEEFLLRRDGIAVTLFAHRRPETDPTVRVVGEDENEDEDEDEDEEEERSKRGCEDEKERNETSTSGRGEEVNRLPSKYSYDEAEALTDEIEEENQMVGEVLRIKELLENHQEQSDGVLFDSLRRLQLMQLSVETLQATEIGKAVSGLKRHSSKKIRHLVRTLIEGWKILVSQWLNATATITDGTPDSVIISAEEEDEEGLPFPPLDEGALLATQTAPIELSKIFDGLDDDGNLQTNGQQEKNSGRRISEQNQYGRIPHEKHNGRISHQNHNAERKQLPPKISAPLEPRGQPRRPVTEVKQTMQDKSRQTKPQPSSFNKQSRAPATVHEINRPSRPASEFKVNSLVRTQHRQDPVGTQRRNPPAPALEKSKNSEDASVRAKLEIAKRRLHEGYQQAENAKKQRTIQVMEIHDLPKQGYHPRQPQQSNVKHKNKLRDMLKGRR